MSLTFGTYRITGQHAADLVTMALEAGVTRVDTAHLYKNESAVFEAIQAFERAHPDRPAIHVTSKIHKNLLFEQTIRAVENSTHRLGRPLDMMLLHRPLPFVMWRGLDASVERGLVREIGVSNFDAERLQELLAACTPGPHREACRHPALDQVEFHPFIGPVQPLLSMCRQASIRVQGHTLLTRGQMFDFPPLVNLAKRYDVSPAIIMLRWAELLGVELVIHTSNRDHLNDILHMVRTGHPNLSPRDMVEINGYYGTKTHRFFTLTGHTSLHTEFSDISDTDEYVRAVAARLDRDRQALETGEAISDIALNLPANTNIQLLTDPVANKLALALFPLTPGKTESSSYQRFRDLIRKLRSHLHAQRRGQPKAKKTSCAVPAGHPALEPVRFVDGEPISHAIAYPRPMPVDVAPADELQPFFDFLANPNTFAPTSANIDDAPILFDRGAYFTDQRMDLCKQVVGPQHIGALCDAVLTNQRFAHATPPLTFTRGSYFSDQRMDLCKQVVGPQHIEALCESVEQQVHSTTPQTWGRVRHFLLGNNIACDGPSIAGAKAIARLMTHPDVDIETWYLAGNCIGPADMGILARALEHNTVARALWLKRNPLGADGAAHLGRFLGINRDVCLLDVNNTGLFDEGAEALSNAFLRTHGSLHLRHLYASSNGFTARGITAFRAMLVSSLPEPSSLVSLSLSLNRLGQPGLDATVELIQTGALARLERLGLGSIGLEDSNVEELCEALQTHCPRLRSLNLGTHLSTRDLGEKANRLSHDVTPLTRLLREHPSLELLDVFECSLPENSLERLLEALGPHQSLHGAGARGFHHSEQERRFLKHPRRVVHIDSIYRGRA